MRIGELETPVYVYDLAEIERSHALLLGWLPQPSTLLYSVKANPHPAVVAALAAAGCGAEICSSGELLTALEAGVEPARLFYTGPGRRDSDLEVALRAGVRRFSTDSPTALDQLERLCGMYGVDATCLLRVNDSSAPGHALAMVGEPSQFGADLRWILDEPQAFADRDRVKVRGLHLFMGSNVSDEAALTAQFARSIETAACLRAAGVDLRLLNLGGGFSAPFAREGSLPRYEQVAGRLDGLLTEAFPDWQSGDPEIAFESGRYLVAGAGRLVTRVLDVKRSFGRQVVVLESGVNHLGGMSGLRRLPAIAPTLMHENTASKERLETMVTGPLCTPLDRWSTRALLPALAVGDEVVIPNVGAYGLSASLVAFLGHPLPGEAVVRGEEVLETSRLRLQRHRD
jgi:diaminopimelate decarboxylase